MNNKIYFVSDGTLKTGEKIIAALEQLGGDNYHAYEGDANGCSYYITPEGRLSFNSYPPSGYHLKDIRTYNMGQQFKVGDKVNIPKTKSVYRGIENSGVVKRAVNRNQPYLFIKEINDRFIVCDDDENYSGGDFFLPSDLTLYNQNENNQNENNMKTIKKTDLKKIHNVACSTWKDKIKEIAKREIFGNTVELTQNEIDEMFAASDTQQTKVLESVFGKQIKDLDFRSNSLTHEVDGIQVFGVGSMQQDDAIIGLPRVYGDDSFKNTLFLNSNYNFELWGDELIVTRK